MTLDEIISKACPFDRDCVIEKQKTQRRREELKKNIEQLLKEELEKINLLNSKKQ